MTVSFFLSFLHFPLDCGNWLIDSRFLQGLVRANSHATTPCQHKLLFQIGSHYHDQSDIYVCIFIICRSRFWYTPAPAPNQPSCHCHLPFEESVDVGSLVFLGIFRFSFKFFVFFDNSTHRICWFKPKFDLFSLTRFTSIYLSSFYTYIYISPDPCVAITTMFEGTIIPNSTCCCFFHHLFIGTSFSYSFSWGKPQILAPNQKSCCWNPTFCWLTDSP